MIRRIVGSKKLAGVAIIEKGMERTPLRASFSTIVQCSLVPSHSFVSNSRSAFLSGVHFSMIAPSIPKNMSTASSPDPMDFVKSTISSEKVVVFSKSTCPYCAAVKGLFQNLGVETHVVELNQRPDGSAIQASLMKLTGQRTVPNVFVNGMHVGGNDDTQRALRSGELKQMLAKAKL